MGNRIAGSLRGCLGEARGAAWPSALSKEDLSQSEADLRQVAAGVDVGDHLGNGLGHLGCDLETYLLLTDGAQEAQKLIGDALVLQLVEIALVVRRVLVAQLKVVGFPPGGGDIDVPVRPGYDQLTLGLDLLTDLDGGSGVGIGGKV